MVGEKKRVLICASVPAVLYHAILYSLSHYKEQDVILLGDAGVYGNKSCHYGEFLQKLKGEKIFTDIIVAKTVINAPFYCSKDTPKGIQDIYISHFDNLFKDIGLYPSDFSEILVINDTWDADINLYFNLKGIEYFWLEPSVNFHLHLIEGYNVKNLELKRLVDSLKVRSGAAPFAKPILRYNSYESMKKLSTKGYLLWNQFEDLRALDLNNLGKILRIHEFKEMDIDENVALFLMSSYAYLERGFKKILESIEKLEGADSTKRIELLFGVGNFTQDERFSQIYGMVLDIFVKDSNTKYLKAHPNNIPYLSNKITESIYGENVKLFTRVPIEFAFEFFRRNGNRISRIITADPGIVEIIDPEVCDDIFYINDIHYYNTGFYYMSLYVLAKIACGYSLEFVWASECVSSQIEMLCKYFGNRDIRAKIYRNMQDIESGLLIIDALEEPNISREFLRMLPMDIHVAFINVDLLSDLKYKSFLKSCFPVKIKKRPLYRERVTSLLARDEIVWIYSKDMAFRRYCRMFQMSKRMEASNMDVSVDFLTIEQEENILKHEMVRSVICRVKES